MDWMEARARKRDYHYSAVTTAEWKYRDQDYLT
jgi:hypothetical protein